ncbi:winged helix-turn-helix transcriptional regulator [Candidatus Atribacteria bacterium 1244-E10-H5-B2]|nr:MAG: winged helix-turn-helix transcriptional regulator [Candidatus Atribacteria bacterium 1244-E10-H5-B2]
MPKSKHLDTLLELKEDPSLSQRSLAHKLNISLGLTNSILQNLIRRGLIKAQKMTGRKILYLITPVGMVQATNFIYDRVRETQHYYQYAKDLLTTHFNDLYSKGKRRVVIYGTGQLAEITYLSLLDSPLKLHSILTDDPISSSSFTSFKKKFLGHEILTLSEFVQKISKTPASENLIILSTISREKDEKGKGKTQSLETEIKKYNDLSKKIKIINLESILKNST